MKNSKELTKEESVELDGGVHGHDGKGCLEPNPFQPLRPPFGGLL